MKILVKNQLRENEFQLNYFSPFFCLQVGVLLCKISGFKMIYSRRRSRSKYNLKFSARLNSAFKRPDSSVFGTACHRRNIRQQDKLR